MDFSINFFNNDHQSFSDSIALQMVWAAGDVVHLVEFKEVMELPGSVTWAIVTFQYKWMSKLSKDDSHFLYHQMCGSIWNFPH